MSELYIWHAFHSIVSMKRSTLFPLLFSLSSLFFLASCEKENIAETLAPPAAVEQMEDIEVSDSFDWSTSQTVEFKIQLSSDNLIRIATADGAVYHRAKLKGDEVYSVKVTLPAYCKFVSLKVGNDWVDLAIDSKLVFYSNL